jgi:hypothetical protein
MAHADGQAEKVANKIVMEPYYIVAGDLHTERAQYGLSVRYEDNRRCVEAIIQEGCANPDCLGVIFTGDTFHRKTLLPKYQMQLQKIAQRLHEAGKKLFAIDGNHDSSDASWLDTVSPEINANGRILKLGEVTEPFVLVEVCAKEDVVALYDQGEDHLANAFTYEGDRITGMSNDAALHIQNFFLAEGAWYLQELNSPEKDAGTSAQAAVAGIQEVIPSPEAKGAAVSNEPGFFVPTLEQRQLLRDIQVTAEALRHIKPDPSAGWDRQVQKLLLSQQVFGIGDPEKAFAEGKVRLDQLIGQAESAGIPANVVESNVAQGDVPEMEEEEE